jgi:prophage regulatory protein
MFLPQTRCDVLRSMDVVFHGIRTWFALGSPISDMATPRYWRQSPRLDQRTGDCTKMKGQTASLRAEIADILHGAYDMRPSYEKKVLRKSQVAKKTGLSESTIDNRCDVDSPYFDAQFPQPRDLGGGRSRSAIGWANDEVEHWIDTRPPVQPKRQLAKAVKYAAPPADRPSTDHGFVL